MLKGLLALSLLAQAGCCGCQPRPPRAGANPALGLVQFYGGKRDGGRGYGRLRLVPDPQ